MKQSTVNATTCKVGQAARLLGEVNIQACAVQQKVASAIAKAPGGV